MPALLSACPRGRNRKNPARARSALAQPAPSFVPKKRICLRSLRFPTFLSPPSLRDTSPYHKRRHFFIMAPLCKGSWLSVGQTEGLSARFERQAKRRPSAGSGGAQTPRQPAERRRLKIYKGGLFRRHSKYLRIKRRLYVFFHIFPFRAPFSPSSSGDSSFLPRRSSAASRSFSNISPRWTVA